MVLGSHGVWYLPYSPATFNCDFSVLSFEINYELTGIFAVFGEQHVNLLSLCLCSLGKYEHILISGD